jgi:hypothetical protein
MVCNLPCDARFRRRNFFYLSHHNEFFHATTFAGEGNPEMPDCVIQTFFVSRA